MGLTTFARNALLNHLFGKSTYTAPTHVYLGLSTTTPTANGSNITEPTGNGYVRRQTSPSDWVAATASSVTTAGDLIFATATPLSWGTVTYGLLYDAETGGNCLDFGELTTPRTIVAGDAFIVRAGGITLSITA